MDTTKQGISSANRKVYFLMTLLAEVLEVSFLENVF